MKQNEIRETEVNIIAEGTRLEGQISLDHVSRVHGTLVGQVHAPQGSTLVLCESGVIEGNVKADILVVDGFIRGDVEAATKVVISGTGRLVGNIKAPSVLIDFGAFFEGRCLMESSRPPTSDPALKPA